MKKFIFVLALVLLVGCKKNRPEAAVRDFLQFASAGDSRGALELLVVEDESVKDEIIELIATRKTYALIKLISKSNSSARAGATPDAQTVNLTFDFCTTKVEGKYKVCVYEDDTPQGTVEKFLKFVGRGDVKRAEETLEVPDEAARAEIVAMIEAKNTLDLIMSMAKYDIQSLSKSDSETFSTIAGLDFCVVRVEGKNKICVDQTAWANRPNKPAPAPAPVVQGRSTDGSN